MLGFKSIIDESLAKHYGFMEEELDFIINYDIKYRMGDELNAEKLSDFVKKIQSLLQGREREAQTIGRAFGVAWRDII